MPHVGFKASTRAHNELDWGSDGALVHSCLASLGRLHGGTWAARSDGPERTYGHRIDRPLPSILIRSQFGLALLELSGATCVALQKA
eukprot:164906-Pyramimonas_sp.AAC.2